MLNDEIKTANTNEIEALKAQIAELEEQLRANTGNRNSGDWNTGNRNSGDWNTGNCNTGNCNTGDWNTGNCNTGYRNTGYRNTGGWNTGGWNSGNWNSGNWNTGDWNTGDWNTGDWNTGDCNTGDWNTGDWNTGCFNTKTSKIKLFNKDSDWNLNDWINSKACQILENCPSSYLDWVELDDMTDKEKAEHPESETTGGFLKKVKPDKTPQEWWNALSEYDKKEVLNLPNFDAEIFKAITKIDVNEEV